MSAPPGEANALAIRNHFNPSPEVKELIASSMHDRIASIAQGYTSRCRGHVEKDDLMQCGMLGLAKAIAGYDPSAGEFEPYALSCARGEILHYIRDHSLTIKVPGSVKEIGIKIQEYRERCYETTGIYPEAPDIAEALSLSMGRTEHCLNILLRRKTTETLENYDQAVGINGNLESPIITGNNDEIYAELLAFRHQGFSARRISELSGLPVSGIEKIIPFLDADLGTSTDEPERIWPKLRCTASEAASMASLMID